MHSAKIFLYLVILFFAAAQPHQLLADDVGASVQVNQTEVDAWNNFSDALLAIHVSIIASKNVRIEKISGGYGGEYSRGYRYAQESIIDKSSGLLLSRIRWHNKAKNLVHTIEVFIYNSKNVLIRDYVSAYLPYDRNAPFQTLINFHSYDESLHAFRQFDASGERLFEKCEGSLWGGDVAISLEDYEMPDQPFDYSATYLACFSSLPLSAGRFLSPLAELKIKNISSHTASVAPTDYQDAIAYYTKLLEAKTDGAGNRMKRAEAYFHVYEFENAIADFSRVIKNNPNLDEAYFGRGLAYGRNQQFELAVSDLGEYIRRNPNSSRAYTKRGVRYIWMGNFRLAKKDLLKAIALNAGNAEAHDDVGVLFAQEKRYTKAIGHFQASIKSDPTYQKAFHNLSLAYYLTNKNRLAMRNINEALKLDPVSKNSTLLKVEILLRGDRNREAKNLAAKASLMKEPNWSEVMTPAGGR